MELGLLEEIGGDAIEKVRVSGLIATALWDGMGWVVCTYLVRGRYVCILYKPVYIAYLPYLVPGKLGLEQLNKLNTYLTS